MDDAQRLDGVSDFLLELLTEEIPAPMQSRAADELRARLEAALAVALGADSLSGVAVDAFVTPRRLAAIVRGLPEASAAAREERRGPRPDAPAKAIEGFARAAGVAVDALVTRNDPKGSFFYAVIDTPGRAMVDVLADVVGTALTSFPWPKSMRWGAASASMDSPRWVRPLTGVVALLGADVVPLTVLGLAAGRVTRGHRFMGAGEIVVRAAETWAQQLRDAYVLVDAGERRARVRDGARAAAAAEGLVLVDDDGLVAENAGLTEWPVPLLGRFDPAFLDVPREAIQLTMRTNQKYFACVEPGGALAPAFVCVANLEAADGGAGIVAGNARVLAARLSDARFFYEQDVREWTANGDVWDRLAPKLERVVFHEKLGSMRDKAERVTRLARWLVESGAVGGAVGGGAPPPNPPHKGEGLDRSQSDALPLVGRVGVGVTQPGASPTLADMAERACRLAKLDLVSAMVGEFPELQGVMGGHYARAAGEAEAVAAAVAGHYRPVGPGDAVPVDPVGVAVALADKLDGIVAFWSIGEKPSGSRDPYALRRSALGFVRLVLKNSLRVSLLALVDETWEPVLTDTAKAESGALTNLVAEASRLGVATISPPSAHARGFSQIRGFATAHDTMSFEVFDWLTDRLKIQQREAEVRPDLIDAVFALGGEDDLVRLLARVRALQGFVGTDDGANLISGYRRAANILSIEAKRDGVARFEGPREPTPSAPSGHLPRVAGEEALAAVLGPVAHEAADAVAREDFTAAMAALARLRQPIDAFFEGVMVNDPVPEVRLARLALLQRFVDAVHQVADFSRIEG